MLVFPQMDPTNSHGFLSRRSEPRGPPAFKIEKRQEKPQEEEIPIRAMAALKTSRRHCPRQHQPYDLPSWRQIKTLTNQAKNLIFQQGMPRNPENIFVALRALLACASTARTELINYTYWAYSTPLYFRL